MITTYKFYALFSHDNQTIPPFPRFRFFREKRATTTTTTRTRTATTVALSTTAPAALLESEKKT